MAAEIRAYRAALTPERVERLRQYVDGLRSYIANQGQDDHLVIDAADDIDALIALAKEAP